MPEDESLLDFPCAFPLKVMGAAVPEFRDRVVEIVRKHVDEGDLEEVRESASSGGRYLALTITFQAQSRAQLDALYRELTGCELVAVAL
jgi:putative lipoic acid-binding regulatory protein